MSDGQSADKALVYEDTLPLSWHRLPGAPEPAEIARFNASALHVLQAAMAWDEISPTETTDEEGSVHSQDLLRLEIKLNLVLELLSDLISQRGLVPPSVPVRLTGEKISWETTDRLATGDHVRLGLYLVAGLPKALSLPAVAENVSDHGETCRIQARFMDLTGPVRDLLDRLLFRFHRRRVAEARRRITPA